MCVSAHTTLSICYLDLRCPTLVRSDLGSENVIIAACQAALRHRHTDRYAGLNSVKYGRSVHNSVG